MLKNHFYSKKHVELQESPFLPLHRLYFEPDLPLSKEVSAMNQAK